MTMVSNEGMTHGELILRDTHEATVVVKLIYAKSRKALSRAVKERNHRDDTGCGADCTGQIYLRTCQMLRAYRIDNEWVGVIEIAGYRDV